ncbi:alpha/beta fold hydrolase [uncultured Roseobacter sp.]|uniref:alpha/beta fold hydrolase n=1 Tax=uncultured Roseobacter sp. TaxID=114847 RepID=UPI00262AD372|nr:alpha/beta hydrolase [uncultured Roseobacter sp.]
MELSAAPFFTDISHGPADGVAHWVSAGDGRRIRVGHWPLSSARGTVLIFPGRTEFIEKYGQVASAFADRGLASAAIDWRGQGLSDRLLDDPLIGHVESFTDYQKDVAALIRVVRQLGLPRPLYLLAHSMGGAIGLRAAMEGLGVRAVTFSGPMWGIYMKPHIRPFAKALGHVMPAIGQGHRLPPGTKTEHHVLVDGFDNNLLTRDPDQFEIMRQQLVAHPELALGGPSYVWLREALHETSHLAGRPSPGIPCLTFVGSNERIVDVPAIHNRMAAWPRGETETVDPGEHEVLMESAEVTGPLFDRIAAHFSTGAGP